MLRLRQQGNTLQHYAGSRVSGLHVADASVTPQIITRPRDKCGLLILDLARMTHRIAAAPPN
jgi:hypothetical protein